MSVMATVLVMPWLFRRMWSKKSRFAWNSWNLSVFRHPKCKILVVALVGDFSCCGEAATRTG